MLSYLGACGVTLPLRGPSGPLSQGLLVSAPAGWDSALLAWASRFTEAVG
ncbi:hypothetical protein [Mycolicibacterium sp. 624]